MNQESKPVTPGAPRHYHIPLKRTWQIAKRVGHKIFADNLQVVTAGCAFYALFAIFPALWASISLFGLVTNEATVENEFSFLSTVLPGQAYDIVIDQIRRIASTSGKALGWSFGIGLVIALWSANLGTQAMFYALKIAYGRSAHSNIWLFYLSAFACTIVGILGVVVMLFAIVYVPILFADAGQASVYQAIVKLVRWPFLALLVLALLTLIYRYGPGHRGAEWKWVSVGAVFATTIWLLASIGFSYYVSHFATNYDRMYGSLGAVIVLLLWLYLSFFIVLVGAEINAVLEEQSEEDAPLGFASSEEKVGAVTAAGKRCTT